VKISRHNKILELIANEAIDTQKGLLSKLREEGYDVTQATVSRDIREMGIHKVRAENGKYRYVSLRTSAETNMSGKFATIFCESVQTIECAQNIVVVKCFTGMANAVCATFDAVGMEEVVGTLAGDDTFLIITRDTQGAQLVSTRLNKLLHR
jgi:transcriptional regulator of arginine metabolism